MFVPRFCFAVQALVVIKSNKFLDPHTKLAEHKIYPVGRYYSDRLSPFHFCYSVDEIENKFKVKFPKDKTITFSQSIKIEFLKEENSIEALEKASRKELPRKAKRTYVTA